ncbi:MAG: V-type ATPase subunit [candidate division WOR-3 bacterium]|nr:V-type ATPase subunit [candidate division WOR-3 bacterium]
MRFSEDTTYSFVIGRIRAREALLLRRSDYERLINVENDEEILKELQSRYQLEDIEEQAVDLEKFLNLAYWENQMFFQKYCRDRDLYNLVVDRTILERSLLLEYLRKFNNDFLDHYFTNTVDLENIRNALRIKYLSEKTDSSLFSVNKDLNQIWLKGGKIAFKEAVKYFLEPWPTIIDWASKTEYASCLVEGIEYLLGQNSFLRLERKIEEAKQQILLWTRYLVFGYEPLIAYYLFKDNEIRNLRRIHRGIKVKVSSERLKESIACVL